MLAVALAVLSLAGCGVSERKPWRPPPLVPKPLHLQWHEGAPPGGGWPGFRAAADGETVYYTKDADRWDRQHEVGHVFDSQLLRDSDRRRLLRIMHLGAGREWVENAYDEKGNPTGRASPSEIFADWYGNARLGQGPGWARQTKQGPVEAWDPGYGSNATPRQYMRFLRTVNAAARRGGQESVNLRLLRRAARARKP